MTARRKLTNEQLYALECFDLHRQASAVRLKAWGVHHATIKWLDRNGLVQRVNMANGEWFCLTDAGKRAQSTGEQP